MSDHPPRVEVVSAAAIDERAFREGVERLLPFLRSPAGAPVTIARASVRIVKDPEMSALHERHSKVSGTTDVLTFVWVAPPAPIEVDIAICIDEAARRASEFGHDCARELLLYALHGLLHAAGFRDDDEASHAQIHAEEDRILKAAGIGAVYDPERRSP